MRKLTSLLLLTGVVALGLAACDDDEPTQPAPSVDQVSVTPQSVELQVGSTAQLAAQVQTSGNASPTVTWNSGDSDIATVDGEGVVTGVAEGNTTVTATATAGESSKSAAAQVTVNPAPAEVEAVSVSPSEFTVGIGQTTQLSATVDAQEGISTAVNWSSSNTDVATVDSEGVVTGESSGNVNITATSDVDPSKSATATGTVEQASDATAVINDVIHSGSGDDDVEGGVRVVVQFDEGSQTITEAAILVDDTVVDSQTFSSEDIQAMISQDVFEADFEFNSAAFDEDGTAAFENGEHDLKARVTTASGDSASDEVLATKTITFDNETTLAFTGSGGLGSITFASDTANNPEDGRRWIEGDVTATVKPVTYGEDTGVETITLSWDTAGTGTSSASVNDGSNSDAVQTQEANDDGEFVFNWYNLPIGDTADDETVVDDDNSIDAAEARVKLNADRVVFSDGTEESDVATSNEENVDNEQPDLDVDDQDWINADFDFLADGISDTTDAVDDGVQGVSFAAEFDGDAVETGDDLPESEDASDNEMEVEYTASDLLNNDSTVTDELGVDKTDPTIEFRGASVDDSALFTTNTSRPWRVNTEDELSGTETVQTKLVRHGPADLLDGESGLINDNAQCRLSALNADDECEFADGDLDTELDASDANGSDGDIGYYEYSAYVDDVAGNSAGTITRIAVLDDDHPTASVGVPSDAEGGATVEVPSSANDGLDLDEGEFSLLYPSVPHFDPEAQGAGADFLVRYDAVDFGSFGTDDFVTSESGWVSISDFVRGAVSVDASASTTTSDPDKPTTLTVESVLDVAGNDLNSTPSADVSGNVEAVGDGFNDELDQFQIITPDGDETIEVDGETLELVAEASGTDADTDPFSGGGVRFYAKAANDDDTTAWIQIGDGANFQEATNTQRYEFSWSPTQEEFDRIQDLASASGSTQTVVIVALGVDGNGDALFSSSTDSHTITLEE